MAKDKVVTVHGGASEWGDPTVLAAERPVAVAGTGLASLLIPCCGQLEYTKLCVPAVLRYTRAPFELIFVDVGSLDGTAEYLAGLAAGSSVRVEVVRAATDLEIGKAVAEAVARARGEYLVLLNNDCIVTEGWLQQLTALAGLSFGMGLVGPMSNYAVPPQWVEAVPYRVGPRRGGTGKGSGEWLVDVEAVQKFAREHHELQRGKWAEAERLGGFCLLVKRTVLEKVGRLEEAAEGLGLFDTDALSVAARRAGFTLAVCRDLFVHHFGTRTFAHGAPLEETKA